MTDNDDLDPSRRVSSSPSRDEGERYNEAKVPPPLAHVARATRAGLIAHQVAPTDPEVPAAKKRGVRRQRRSLVGLAAVVVGLLSITVSLLYRASRRVSAPRAAGEGAPHTSLPRTDAIIFQRRNAPAGIVTGLRPPAPMPYRDELDGDDRRDDGRSPVGNAAASSAAPQPKGPTPAIDIIRTPAF